MRTAALRTPASEYQKQGVPPYQSSRTAVTRALLLSGQDPGHASYGLSNSLLRVFATLLFFLTLSLAQNRDFSAPGRYGNAFRDVDIPGTTETMRNSRIYYPDSSGIFPKSAVPAPIIAFGHGWMIGISSYYSYARHLASWGYVVVLPAYSNPIINPEHDKRARLMADAARWVAARDTVPSDPLHGKLDRWNWGFVGHSMGGSISMLAADTLVLRDTLRAVAALASPQSNPPTHSEHILAPKMILAGGADNIAPWRDVRQAYWAKAPAPGTFAVIRGANHFDFLDAAALLWSGSTLGRDTTQLVVRRHLTAFFERYLQNDRSDWNYAYVFGDSIRRHPTMDSVEVRPDPVGVRSSFVRAPAKIDLRPNPARTRVLIRYGVPVSGPVQLTLHDRLGTRVATILNRSEPAGEHALFWTVGTDDRKRPPAGTYFLRVLTSAGSEVRRLSLLD